MATFRLLPLASTDWQCCMNGGAVSARINMKIAADLLHSGDHPWNANAGAERLSALVSRGLLRALPVIPDDQTQSLVPTSDIYRNARCAGVAINIGQCFLNNSERQLKAEHGEVHGLVVIDTPSSRALAARLATVGRLRLPKRGISPARLGVS
jgi:hypothetical protein